MSGGFAVAATEHWRPSLHFTPRRNWINDPNGLVWLDGEYHLFYQYNPEGDRWGEIGWGHAVSADGLHWQELPMALPASPAEYVFSGSVVVDAANTAGFAAPECPAPLVAIYTSVDRLSPSGGGLQTQHIAHSLDRGRSWRRWAGNPVLDLGLRDFRDPKVIWHAPSARWVMAVVVPHEQQVAFFASTDLKAWHELSRFGPAGPALHPPGDTSAQGAIWECPDLIELPHPDGVAAGGTAWVLKVDAFAGHPGGSSGGMVFIGQFDGTRFTPQGGDAGAAQDWADWGCDFYAAASWANLPSGQPPLWLAWASNHRYGQEAPTSPWRGQMTLPRTLALHQRADGRLQLAQQPLPALAACRGAPWTHAGQALRVQPLVLADAPAARCAELQLVLDPGQADEVALEVLAGASAGGPAGGQAAGQAGGQPGVATRIGWLRAGQRLYIDRSASGAVPVTADFSGRREAPLPLAADGLLRLRIVVDHGLVEVFAGDGVVCLTEQVFPPPQAHALRLWAAGGAAQLHQATVWPLQRQPGATAPAAP